MNASPRFPYLWKIVVAAAVVAVAIVAVREIPKWIPPAPPPNQQPQPAAPADLYADTQSRVREIIAVHTASVPEVVTPAMPLVDAGLDPLTLAEVADALDAAYGIELGDELSTVTSVEDLVQLVVKKRQSAQYSR